MKKNLLIILTFLGLLFSYSSFAVVNVKNADTKAFKEDVKNETKAVKSDWENLSRKEKRAQKKKVKKELKSYLKSVKKAGSVSSTTLLVIIALFIPPLAMALYDGISRRFWISLLLTLLFVLPGLIYTLIVILNGN